MLLQQLSQALSTLTPAQADAYMRYILSAHEVNLPHTSQILRDIAADHEVQFLTNDDAIYPIGVGDSEVVHMSKQAYKELADGAQELVEVGLPIYLIHNHPASSLAYDTLPSPQDIAFWATLPSNVTPAIYFHSSNTAMAFAKPSSEDAESLKGIH